MIPIRQRMASAPATPVTERQGGGQTGAGWSNRHVDDIELIAQMTAAFARSRDIEETLRRGLAAISEKVMAEAAALFLIDPETGDLVCRACWGPTDATGLRLKKGSSAIIWRAVDQNAAQLVRDAHCDPDFNVTLAKNAGRRIRSILCAPLSVQDQRLGAIELFNRRGGGAFNQADRRLVMALASSAAMALINARLTAQMVEQDVLKRELALAAEIQRRMLPVPQPASFPVHGLNVPARGVSGDFFDIVPLANGLIAFAIGDVSGKGINASLLMSKTASLFRCLAKRIERPGDVLAAIDSELAEIRTSGMFVTMIAGVLDPYLGRVVLANAGHDPALLIQGETSRAFGAGSPPLAVAPEIIAQGVPEEIIDLSGGSLTLFTDGATEARGPDGRMLGMDGLERLLFHHRDLPVEERLKRVVAGLHPDGSPPDDDVTLLVVEQTS